MDGKGGRISSLLIKLVRGDILGRAADYYYDARIWGRAPACVSHVGLILLPKVIGSLLFFC